MSVPSLVPRVANANLDTKNPDARLSRTPPTSTLDDRDVTPFPERPTTGLRYRIETLLGLTGWKMSKYRCSWRECLFSWLDCLWRPHALLMYICKTLSLCLDRTLFRVASPDRADHFFSKSTDVGVTFGFGIGINVSLSPSSRFAPLEPSS